MNSELLLFLVFTDILKKCLLGSIKIENKKIKRCIWESATQTRVHLQPEIHVFCVCGGSFMDAPKVTQMLREVCSYNFMSVLMCYVINHIYLSKHFSHLLSFFNYFYSVLGGFLRDNLSLKFPIFFYLAPVRAAGSTRQILEIKKLAVAHETLSNS